MAQRRRPPSNAQTPEAALAIAEREALRFRELVDADPILVSYARVLLDVVSDAQWTAEQRARGLRGKPCDYAPASASYDYLEVARAEGYTA